MSRDLVRKSSLAMCKRSQEIQRASLRWFPKSLLEPMDHGVHFEEIPLPPGMTS